MFTGIIMALGTIVERTEHRVSIDAPALDPQRTGDSVAVDGCCLTVVSCEDGRLVFDLLPETLERTRIGGLQPGELVNLEPALRVGEPLGGHWVQGHVDATGSVVSRRLLDAGMCDMWLDVPAEIHALCIERGSITVNGVSLTVMQLGDDATVRVQLIPETLARTNLGTLAAGARVNLEADVLARYVRRLLPSHG